MFYSASSDCFYPRTFRDSYEGSGTWPTDAVAVTDKEWQIYGAGSPPPGKRRAANDNGHPTWVDIPPPSIDDLADAAMRRINAGYQADMNTLLAAYPDAETLTFDKQEREARAWSDWQAAGGDEPATPFISSLAQGRQMTKAELVERIIAKADAWTHASGIATGRRQLKEDQIATAREAEDRETLEAISW